MTNEPVWAELFCYPPKILLNFCVLFACITVTSPASASDKLMVEYPGVAPGELEVGMRGQVLFDNNSDVNNARTLKLGAGYGFSNIWFSELYAEYEKPADGTDYKVQFYEWENLFRLTEPGRYWADWGIILEYSHATDEVDKDAYKIMPIVQKRFSKTMTTLNLGFERNPTENGTNSLQFSYGWQYLWLGNPAYQFALEGYGQVGEVTHWAPKSQQTHQIGPALVGKFKSGPDSGWEYRMGLYFGLTSATPNEALIVSVEYEL